MTTWEDHKIMMQYPHCDAKVLHAPEDGCKYCNSHPEWQELRQTWGINFTGHNEPGFDQCPAEKGRPLETIEKWHGNVPMTPEQETEDEAYWAEFRAKCAEEWPANQPKLSLIPAIRRWWREAWSGSED